MATTSEMDSLYKIEGALHKSHSGPDFHRTMHWMRRTEIYLLYIYIYQERWTLSPEYIRERKLSIRQSWGVMSILSSPQRADRIRRIYIRTALCTQLERQDTNDSILIWLSITNASLAFQLTLDVITWDSSDIVRRARVYHVRSAASSLYVVDKDAISYERTTLLDAPHTLSRRYTR